jgi:hypothetical protein
MVSAADREASPNMAKIPFSCPACKRTFNVPAAKFGTDAPCPACKTVVRLPPAARAVIVKDGGETAEFFVVAPRFPHLLPWVVAGAAILLLPVAIALTWAVARGTMHPPVDSGARQADAPRNTVLGADRRERVPMSREEFRTKGGFSQNDLVRGVGPPDKSTESNLGIIKDFYYGRATFDSLTKRVDSYAIVSINHGMIQDIRFLP